MCVCVCVCVRLLYTHVAGVYVPFEGLCPCQSRVGVCLSPARPQMSVSHDFSRCVCLVLAACLDCVSLFGMSV